MYLHNTNNKIIIRNNIDRSHDDTGKQQSCRGVHLNCRTFHNVAVNVHIGPLFLKFNLIQSRHLFLMFLFLGIQRAPDKQRTRW